MRLRHKIKQKYEEFYIFRKKIWGAENFYKIPFFKRIIMSINGFTANQYVRYELYKNDKSEYISEMERWKTRKINRRYNITMDDKLIFQEVFGKYVNTPRNFGWINDKKIFDLTGKCISEDDFLSLLIKQKKIVIKPTYGTGGGRGVHIVEKLDNGIYIDKKLIDNDELCNRIYSLDDYIICEFINQHQYASDIFDKTTNTIRLITIINSNDGTARITNALHRIGVESSIPVDNVLQGGLVAKIDLKTGVIGKAKSYYTTSEFSNHPESKAKIEGVQVPFWDTVKKKIIEVAENFPYIYFMAWDIVITEDSFSVIEINASTGIDLIQLWGGEKNKELGRFYKKHNIFR